MTQMLRLSEREFKIALTNMLKALMKKVDNIHEKMANFSIEMKTGKESMEIHKWKTETEMKNSLDGLIYKLKTAEEKSVNLKIGQQKLLKLKHKEKKK